MTEQNIRFNYRGSIFWLIFWTILFFPVALVLFVTGASYAKGGMNHHLRYNGDRFWLCFWALFFFPVALLLFFLKGFTIIREPL
jgi:hypothetical protein